MDYTVEHVARTKSMCELANGEMAKLIKDHKRGLMSAVEFGDRLIDIWMKFQVDIKNEMAKYALSVLEERAEIDKELAGFKDSFIRLKDQYESLKP